MISPTLRGLCIAAMSWICMSLFASPTLPKKIANEISSQIEATDGDHQAMLDSVTYLVAVKNGVPVSIKLPILESEAWSNFDLATKNYIEQAIALNILNIKSERFVDVKLLKGKWSSLKNPISDQQIAISIMDSKTCELAIDTPEGECLITFPIEYDKINGGSRADIEQNFIDGLAKFEPKTRPIPDFSIEELERIENNLFILKGESYILADVNQNKYIEADATGEACFVVNPEMPAATIANMINVGVGYPADLNMTISKHEYGEKEIVTIPLENFIQYCMRNGCDIFWGLDVATDTTLKGTIFCYNPTQGYDHVVRIECDPSEMGNEGYVIKAHASLFIPTNNVSNLFEEYKPKTENEKIKYN